MKWFVDEAREFPERQRFQDAPSQTYLELTPARECFVGGLIGEQDRTQSPTDADFFLAPWLFNVLGMGSSPWFLEQTVARVLQSLPAFAKSAARHVIFFLGDNSYLPECCSRSAVFMPSCRRGSGAFALPYFAEPPDRVPRPMSACAFDVGFQGATTTGGGLRDRLVAALRTSSRYAVDCYPTAGYFHMTYDLDGQAQLAARYREHLDQCRFIASPRGDGLSSLRFFEALAWGRIPILISDHTALPLQDIIPYHEFVIRVPEGDTENWEAWLDDFVATAPDLERASRLAAETSRSWFAPAALHRLVMSCLMSR